MTEPQVWTLIGVFAAIMLGGLTLSTNLIMRSTNAAIAGLRGEFLGEIAGLRGELGGEIAGLGGEITGLRGELTGLRNEMSARFDATDAKIERLDDDVSLLMRRAWEGPSRE